MPTSINFDKKLGFINGTSIVLPSGSGADFSTRSLFFDGIDDHIETSTTYSELDGGTKLSLSIWIKPISGSPFLEYIVSNPRDTTANNSQFALTLYEGSNISFNVQSRTSQYVAASISAINYGQWNHVLVCVDLNKPIGTEGIMFINGVDQTATSAMGTLIDANGGFNRYNGYLDELAIWAGQDLRNDVATIYNNGKPADLTSLNPTSWYRAGESSTFAYPQILMPEDTNKDKVSKYSIAFDGTSDYIDCGDPDEFSFTSGKVDSRFSLSAWVYMNDATRFRVLSKINSSSNAEYAFYTSAADQLYFVLYTNSTSNRISRYTSATLTSYEGQWIHLAATYDGSGTSNGLKIYLNGNRVDDTTSDVGVYSAMLNTNAPLTIGKYQDVTSTYANGKIDEAAVFGFDLGQSAVQAIYNSGIPTDISSYSPVGYWKLGEEAKFTDNWLVPNSALSNFSKYSFNFDGLDDYIDCGNSASLQITGALSISFWLYGRNNATHTGIITKTPNTSSVASATQYHIQFQNSNQLRFAVTGCDLYAGTETTGTVPTVVAGVWQHITMTWNGSDTMTIYKDGAPVCTKVQSTTIVSNTSPVWLGRRAGFGLLLGKLDEVAIFNSELSAFEVTAIYNGGKPKDLSGFSPISWWRMGEEATYDGGTNQFTIPDQGSGGNTGTSSNTMLLETLVGDTPQYYGGGISDSMDIFDRVGDAPNSENNTVSFNMEEADIVEDTP
jgi:hypothetical protein